MVGSGSESRRLSSATARAALLVAMQGVDDALRQLHQMVADAAMRQMPVVVNRQVLEAQIQQVPHAQLRQAMIQTFAELQQGLMTHGFRVLQGGRCLRRAACHQPASPQPPSLRRTSRRLS